jgi:precorrin-6x reductase
MKLLTDSKRVVAEFPKMNEKPRITVARGTNDARELELKINKQMNMMATSATERRTASSLATMDPTSC